MSAIRVLDLTDFASLSPTKQFFNRLLTSWYQQGMDVQKLSDQLSVSLGHAHLADTQVYLSMTPDLLREANARFEFYAKTGEQP